MWHCGTPKGSHDAGCVDENPKRGAALSLASTLAPSPIKRVGHSEWPPRVYRNMRQCVMEYIDATGCVDENPLWIMERHINYSWLQHWQLSQSREWPLRVHSFLCAASCSGVRPTWLCLMRTAFSIKRRIRDFWHTLALSESREGPLRVHSSMRQGEMESIHTGCVDENPIWA